jgi:hypothetical protein
MLFDKVAHASDARHRVVERPPSQGRIESALAGREGSASVVDGRFDSGLEREADHLGGRQSGKGRDRLDLV